MLSVALVLYALLYFMKEKVQLKHNTKVVIVTDH